MKQKETTFLDLPYHLVQDMMKYVCLQDLAKIATASKRTNRIAQSLNEERIFKCGRSSIRSIKFINDLMFVCNFKFIYIWDYQKHILLQKMQCGKGQLISLKNIHDMAIMSDKNKKKHIIITGANREAEDEDNDDSEYYEKDEKTYVIKTNSQRVQNEQIATQDTDEDAVEDEHDETINGKCLIISINYTSKRLSIESIQCLDFLYKTRYRFQQIHIYSSITDTYIYVLNYSYISYIQIFKIEHLSDNKFNLIQYVENDENIKKNVLDNVLDNVLINNDGSSVRLEYDEYDVLNKHGYYLIKKHFTQIIGIENTNRRNEDITSLKVKSIASFSKDKIATVSGLEICLWKFESDKIVCTREIMMEFNYDYRVGDWNLSVIAEFNNDGNILAIGENTGDVKLLIT